MYNCDEQEFTAQSLIESVESLCNPPLALKFKQYEESGIFENSNEEDYYIEGSRLFEEENFPALIGGSVRDIEEISNISNFTVDCSNKVEEVKQSITQQISTCIPSESNSDHDGYEKQRGRPKDEKDKDPKMLAKYIQDYIFKEFKKIEKDSKQDNTADIALSRKRDDKPRTKIIRHIKKIPLVILKKVVSIGDYKHENIDRLFEAYKTAFDCFRNISEYLNQDCASKTYNESSVDFIILLLEFCTIHFPTTKVIKLALAKLICDEDIKTIKNLCKMKDSCSIKKLKEQMRSNKFISDLFKISKKIIDRKNDFPNTTRVFDALFQELHEQS